MKLKLKGLWTLFLLCLSILSISAQEVIPASGGEASGDGGLASYSVGQIFYCSEDDIQGSVYEGVLQPYEVFVVSQVIDVEDISLRCRIYPNPVSDLLYLTIDGGLDLNWSFKLLDIGGRLLQAEVVKEQETKLSLGHFKSGVYFLKVFKKDQLSVREVKVFKILKR
jgi:hypothetical protein